MPPSEDSTRSINTESSVAPRRTGSFTRSQLQMSQMLSTLLPTSTEDILRKYPALLDVPFISLSEILITREIGSGSFGRVFHGIFSFQDVAVKKLTVRNFRDEIDIYDKLSAADDASDEADKKAKEVAETLLALEKEVGMLKRISFPKVVGFYGVCFDPAAIVSEYCARGSLFDLIARARSSRGVLEEMSWERRLKLANDAAIGMSFLHNRMDPIIHRDLKSPNLLVDEHYNCKVADFNTAGFVDATEITKSQANNPRWLAPEIAESKPHTKESDVYPFGIILWELMTLKRPFEIDDQMLNTYKILIGIVQDDLRPELVPNRELPGGPCPVYDEYVQLMQECWDRNPSARPSFKRIHERLKEMIKEVVIEEKKNKCGMPRNSFSVAVPERAVRETSPLPGRSRSPHSHSPFSRSPVGSPRKEVLTIPTKSIGVESGFTKPSPSALDADLRSDQCLTSPFQNGPPSLSSASGSVRDRAENRLEHPPSFANWSDGTALVPTEEASKMIDYSEVVKHGGGQKTNRGKKLWMSAREKFGLDELMPIKTKQSSRAIERWDSVRTAIFGEPTTQDFQEHFGSFLGGDETAELKKRLNDVESMKTPGLRILKALMELREAREAAERNEANDVAKEEKPAGWCLVKHLMLMSLPRTMHPMWNLVAENIKPRGSWASNLGKIEEGKDHSIERHESDLTEGQIRARYLWKKAREAFLDEDYQKTKPVLHPRWEQLRKVLFSNEDETESSTPSPKPSAPVPLAEPKTERKKATKWNVLRNHLMGEAVENNWDTLLPYAREAIKKGRLALGAGEGSRPPSIVRRLAVVDEEPPSYEKWKVVRSLLMDKNLGKEWHSLTEKAKRNEDPPSGTEWEIFRWLFFENKKLRNQEQWGFIKDLFLRTTAPADVDAELF